jgi:dolichyl-phosphate-mannose--protein O-mannosyl transferase
MTDRANLPWMLRGGSSCVHRCTIPFMYRLDYWHLFLALAASLIVTGAFRSAWATRLDGFTMDEPWHITAGSAYPRTGEHYLNPEHPPLVKLIAALAAPRSVFRFTEPASLHDKIEERDFVEDTMYAHNDADRIQSRVRPVMYVFNGLLLLLFAVSAFRVFGGMVALGALLFALIDPTVAAHWPVVMTELPVGLLSVTCVLVCIEVLHNWTWVNVVLLSIVLGLTLSVKHSGLIAFGFTGLLGLAALIWQFRGEKTILQEARLNVELGQANSLYFLDGATFWKEAAVSRIPST